MKHIIPLLSCLTLLGACATVDRGVIDHVRIDTVPQGATVTVITDDRVYERRPLHNRLFQYPLKTVICEATPCALAINRNDDALVRIEADGYETLEYMVRPSSIRAGLSGDVAKSLLTSGGAGAYYGYGLGNFADAFRMAAGKPSVVPGAAIGVGLAFSGIALAADIGNAANKNLFPNPVVLGLAPEGTGLPDDPMVEAFKDMLRAQNHEGKVCKHAEKDRSLRSDCDQARHGRREKARAYNTLTDEADQALREMARTLRKADDAN